MKKTMDNWKLALKGLKVRPLIEKGLGGSCAI